MSGGLYITPYDVKVHFSMPYFPSRKTITYLFHVENARFYEGISYEMIIGRYLMVKLGLKVNILHHFLEWDVTVVPMNDTGNFLGQSGLTKR